MDIHLSKGMPNGVDYEITNLTDSPDYDMLTVKGPKQAIEFAVEALTPGYGLQAMETKALAEPGHYEKIAFVPKHETPALKSALFSLYVMGQGPTNN